LLGPFRGQLSEHSQPGPRVFTALGIVGGGRGKAMRPTARAFTAERVKILGAVPYVLRLTANLVQSDEPVVTIESGVL
jgi:hypothetical protein